MLHLDTEASAPEKEKLGTDGRSVKNGLLWFDSPPACKDTEATAEGEHMILP